MAKTQTTPTPVATVAVTEPSPPAPVVVNLSGVYAVPITKIDGETVTVRAGDMTQETLANVFAHGLKQLVNDATSAFKAKEDIRKAARAMAERISTNQWSPGKGGGHKLSPFEVELRNVAEMQLRLVCNRTGADAKVVKVGDAARDVAVTMLARKNGGDPSTVTVEMEKPVIEKLMEAWTKVARANLETAAALTIEI